MPWYVETHAIFYRNDLMEQAGFDTLPHTWGGLKELAQVISLRAVAGAVTVHEVRYETVP